MSREPPKPGMETSTGGVSALIPCEFLFYFSLFCRQFYLKSKQQSPDASLDPVAEKGFETLTSQLSRMDLRTMRAEWFNTAVVRFTDLAPQVFSLCHY